MTQLEKTGRNRMSYKTGNGATHEAIRRILRKRKWWSPLDLQQAMYQATGQLYTDATLTRRLREMEDVRCETRKGPNGLRWEYCLVREARAA